MSARVEMSPEERCERVRAALAEAGYPDAAVRWNRHFEKPTVGLGAEWSPPTEEAWRALAVCNETLRCWPCARDQWLSGDYDADCTHDPLTSPWPEVAR